MQLWVGWNSLTFGCCLLKIKKMLENEISSMIIGAGIKIHSVIGPGLLESAYEECLAYEFDKLRLNYKRQVYVPIVYEEVRLGHAFRADFIVEDKIIVEIKSVENVLNVHKAQLLTYLKLTDKRLGLLINFNSQLLKDGISRIANNLREY